MLYIGLRLTSCFIPNLLHHVTTGYSGCFGSVIPHRWQIVFRLSNLRANWISIWFCYDLQTHIDPTHLKHRPMSLRVFVNLSWWVTIKSQLCVRYALCFLYKNLFIYREVFLQVTSHSLRPVNTQSMTLKDTYIHIWRHTQMDSIFSTHCHIGSIFCFLKPF